MLRSHTSESDISEDPNEEFKVPKLSLNDMLDRTPPKYI